MSQYTHHDGVDKTAIAKLLVTQASVAMEAEVTVQFNGPGIRFEDKKTHLVDVKLLKGEVEHCCADFFSDSLSPRVFVADADREFCPLSAMVDLVKGNMA